MKCGGCLEDKRDLFGSILDPGYLCIFCYKNDCFCDKCGKQMCRDCKFQCEVDPENCPNKECNDVNPTFKKSPLASKLIHLLYDV